MCDECNNRDGRFYCDECSTNICLEPTDRFFQSQAVQQEGYWVCQKCAAETPCPTCYGEGGGRLPSGNWVSCGTCGQGRPLSKIYGRDEEIDKDIPLDSDLCPPV